mmetsp:Transcript_52222/g.121916  ORF Transcript_52222/g.121916 Transcript_52222/m.121916 type:complete len:226 (-) Transcript_52222:671-1348(-)
MEGCHGARELAQKVSTIADVDIRHINVELLIVVEQRQEAALRWIPDGVAGIGMIRGYEGCATKLKRDGWIASLLAKQREVATEDATSLVNGDHHIAKGWGSGNRHEARRGDGRDGHVDPTWHHEGLKHSLCRCLHCFGQNWAQELPSRVHAEKFKMEVRQVQKIHLASGKDGDGVDQRGKQDANVSSKRKLGQAHCRVNREPTNATRDGESEEKILRRSHIHVRQ